MKILVTGANGMVGTDLCNNLKNIRDGKNKTRPGINAMGITKALEEKIAVAKSRNSGNTRICCTRYGNVMCSRGSVIPLWIDQIRAGNTSRSQSLQ